MSLVSDIDRGSTQHDLNNKLQLVDYLHFCIKNNTYKRDYATRNFYVLWVLADMQAVKYFNLVADDRAAPGPQRARQAATR